MLCLLQINIRLLLEKFPIHFFIKDLTTLNLTLALNEVFIVYDLIVLFDLMFI